MRIFASWSGKASRDIAILLKDWIPNVLQDVEVYVSSQDIAKGERWLNNVNSNLQDHNFGISIITAENYVAPWILFEAGALAKTLSGRLVPLLCGVDTIAMPNHPLTQFQYVVAPGQEELLRLIQDINSASDRPLLDDRLRSTFEKWYPDFSEAYESIELTSPQSEGRRSSPELVEEAVSEILREMRDIRASLNNATKNSPNRDTVGTPPTIKPRYENVVVDGESIPVRIRERPLTLHRTITRPRQRRVVITDNEES